MIEDGYIVIDLTWFIFWSVLYVAGGAALIWIMDAPSTKDLRTQLRDKGIYP